MRNNGCNAENVRDNIKWSQPHQWMQRFVYMLPKLPHLLHAFLSKINVRIYRSHPLNIILGQFCSTKINLSLHQSLLAVGSPANVFFMGIKNSIFNLDYLSTSIRIWSYNINMVFFSYGIWWLHSYCCYAELVVTGKW